MKQIASLSILFVALIEFAIERARFALWIVAVVAIVTLPWNVVKVVQKLLRHSTSTMTLDTYTQALGPDKRAAHSKVVCMIRPKERVFSVYRDADGVSV
jgi:hypothetical protein